MLYGAGSISVLSSYDLELLLLNQQCLYLVDVLYLFAHITSFNCILSFYCYVK